MKNSEVCLVANRFANAVLQWYDDYGRHDLPWRQSISAYRVWLSEIMLQQTQVQTVIPYFERFLQRFPTLQSLAQAPVENVLALWSGLGYYARARNLHRCAQTIMRDYYGEFPQDLIVLQSLPGIGRSTAGAILALAFNQRAAILDGNVKRILARYHAVDGWPGKTAIQDQLWQYAEAHTPTKRVHDYTQAMMDIGATVCTRSQPRCHACPLQNNCQAYALETPTAFPSSKPRKTIPTKQAKFIAFIHEQKIYLEQRPAQGIWGSLYCLPVCLPSVDTQQWLRYLYGLNLNKTRLCHSFKHTFSHFHLIGDVISAPLSVSQAQALELDTGTWIGMNELGGYGLPAPIKQVLLQFFTDEVKA